MADKRNTGPARRKARATPRSRTRNPTNKVAGSGPLKTKWSKHPKAGYPQRAKSSKRHNRI